MSTKAKTWFISDLHFSHISSLYFHPERRERAGISLEELKELSKEDLINRHDEWLINLWNNTVSKHDAIYILGDFCLGNKNRTEKILQRLNGKKYLIRGNHDKSCNGLERYFEWVGDIKEAKFTNNQYDFIDKNEAFCIEMCHYPLLTWNRRPHGTVHLHGHCHGSIDEYNESSKELRIDAGLDGNFSNYNFIDLESLYNKYLSIRSTTCSKTFDEHTEKIMKGQGFRM